MRLDLFGLFSDGSGHRCNHRGNSVEPPVGGLHLFSNLRDLCGVGSKLCGVRRDVLVIPSDLRVALESFVVLNSLEE